MGSKETEETKWSQGDLVESGILSGVMGDRMESGEREWSQGRQNGVRGDRMESGETEWSQGRQNGVRGDRMESGETEWSQGDLVESGETRGLREGGKGLRERGETEWRRGHRGGGGERWGNWGFSDEKTLNEEKVF